MNHSRVIYLSFMVIFVVAALFALNIASTSGVFQNGAREARAVQADIQRWVAMGESYAQLPASAADFNAQLVRDVHSANWQGLGEAYQTNALRVRLINTARWQSLGEYYLQNQ